MILMENILFHPAKYIGMMMVPGEVAAYQQRGKFIIKSLVQSSEKFKSRKRGDENKELSYFLLRVEDDEGKGYEEGKTQLQNLKEDEDTELEIRIRRNKKGETLRIEFALPNKTNWRKAMEEFRDLLKSTGDTLGQHFYKELIKDKWYKIRNRVVLRMDYLKEFDAIWKEQSKHHPILNNCPKEVLEEIVLYIFPGKSKNQQELRNEGLEKGLFHILRNQIIYYQRE